MRAMWLDLVRIDPSLDSRKDYETPLPLEPFLS